MDPLTPNQSSVAPAPASPEAVPGIPVDGAQAELSQEEMKKNLQDLMAKIEGKYQEFNTQKFSSDNKTKEQKGEILRQLFDLFQSKGIDPNNPEEVKAYLDKIQASNPELFAQIEQALQSILGDDQAGMEANAAAPTDVAPGGAPVDNMNINPNEAPQENI